MLNTPAALSGPVELLPGLFYPAYRLLIIGVGLAVAGCSSCWSRARALACG